MGALGAWVAEFQLARSCVLGDVCSYGALRIFGWLGMMWRAVLAWRSVRTLARSLVLGSFYFLGTLFLHWMTELRVGTLGLNWAAYLTMARFTEMEG